MIKLRIKLDNGLHINKVLNDDMIKQAENHKIFKKIERENQRCFEKVKTGKYYRMDREEFCKKRVEELELYYNFINNL